MFGEIAEKFQSVFSRFGSQKILTEDNIADAVREVRLTLLDADVSYGVVKQFIKRVKEKALGQKAIKSVSPKDLFVKIIHDALKEMMGGEEPSLNLGHLPSVILMCGLQGSGKTTQSAKLALYLQKQKKRVLLAACDLQRPAAIDQIETLAEQVGAFIHIDRKEKDPVKVAQAALSRAKKEAFDVLIIDTAGRLHVDLNLMQELIQIKEAVCPHEVLFVANSATGQDAVKTAAEFDQKISITGTILTMLDGSNRAGAAISIREVTGKPLKFEGIGEKVSDFQLFNPQSMADRILGMGDVINLVKKAQEHVDEKELEKMRKKFLKASFTYDDFLKQLRSIRRMGSFKALLAMVPGISKLGDFELCGKEMGKTEAMILSMTLEEKVGFEELIPSRRWRIAKGSGLSIDDVNRMIKNFKRIKQLMKKMPMIKKKFRDPSDFTDEFGSLSALKKKLGHF